MRKVIRILKEVNPVAAILSVQYGDINPAFVYGVDPRDETVKAHRGKLQKEGHHTHHQQAAIFNAMVEPESDRRY